MKREGYFEVPVPGAMLLADLVESLMLSYRILELEGWEDEVLDKIILTAIADRKKEFKDFTEDDVMRRICERRGER